MKTTKLWKRLADIIVSNIIVGTLIGATIYFTKPEYREFVPTSGNCGYYLNVDKGKTSVQVDGGFQFRYIVDETEDLRPDYTRIGMAANVRLAGQFKRAPTQEEREIFNNVIKKSKRFENQL